MATSDRSTSKRYFYAADGQRLGPVTFDELRQLAASGKLSRSNMVWPEGVEKGMLASWVQGVFTAAPSDGATPVAAQAAPSSARDVEAPPSKQVFISHSSRDADAARQIAAALEDSGIGCWIAPRDIPGGAEYNASIMNGLKAARALLLVHSRQSVASSKVFQEVHQADAHRLPIFPVRIDETKSTPELALLISTYQWIDAFPPPLDRHLNRIVAAVSQRPAPKPVPDKTSRYIGPYQIRKQIGEGGMGTVFLASQLSPIKRDVAIKRIKLGLDTKEVLARFESERQALARMDHPNIARVFDAGADESGKPYFVMEYVPGTPITEFADKNKLSIPKRLALFKQVCQAVAHAHTKGIIHRDIKAGNILAYLQNGEPTTKVIDFGIAKAAGGERLSDRTFATEGGFVVGTYDAMSPEQAEGSPDIDTRTDVYSLGVLLYELLTGAKPFDHDTFAKAADSEIRRMIRDVEPPRPSARLSSIGQTGPQIASARDTEVGSLTKALRSELEWIPMMAMRKERDRRYASPIDLAADIDNYLANRPLKAGPESISYRLRKTLRRHRMALAASLIILALVVGGTTAYIRAIRTEQKRTADALVEVDRQRVLALENERRATVAAEEAERQRQLAKYNEQSARENAEAARQQSQLALQTLRTVVFDIQRGLEDLPGSGYLRRNLLASAIGHFERLSSEFVEQSTVDRHTMDAFIEMGHVMLTFGRDIDDAGANILAALDEKTEMDFADQPLSEVVEYLHQRHGFEVRLDQEALINAGVGTDSPITFSTKDTTLRQSLNRMLSEFDMTFVIRNGMLVITTETEMEVSTLLALGGKSLSVEASGAATAALTLFERAFSISKALADSNGNDVEAQRNLSICYDSLGDATRELGQYSAAKKNYQDGLQINQKIATQDPSEAHQRNLSVSYENLGDVSLQLGQVDEAMRFYQEGFGISQKLAWSDFSDAQNQRDLLVWYEKLGDVVSRLGRTNAALDYYRDGLETSRKLAESDRRDLSAQRDLWVWCEALGDAMRRLGRPGDALNYYRDGLEVSRKLEAERFPADGQALHNLMFSHCKLAETEIQRFQYAAAQAHYESAKQVIADLVKWGRSNEQINFDFQAIEQKMAFCSAAAVAVVGIDKIEEAEADEQPWLLYVRCSELARRGTEGDLASVAEAAHMLREPARKDAEQLFRAACGYSLCVRVIETPPRGGVFPKPDKIRELSREEETARNLYVRLAVETLEQAITAGFTDTAQMRDEQDFLPLRETREFQRLLKEVAVNAMRKATR